MSEPHVKADGRFMIAEPWGEDGYVIRGGAHPYTYKTFRGAAREIRKGGNDGLILQWDPTLLPVVTADAPAIEDPNLADRMSELEFCERQIQLWADRADRVRAGERTDLALSFAQQEDELCAHCKAGHRAMAGECSMCGAGPEVSR